MPKLRAISAQRYFRYSVNTTLLALVAIYVARPKGVVNTAFNRINQKKKTQLKACKVARDIAFSFQCAFLTCLNRNDPIYVEGVTLVLPSRLFMFNKYWRILALS